MNTSSPAFQLAQVNLARARAPLDAPEMRGFVEALEEINRLAEAAPGFVWRFQTEKGDATDVRPGDDPFLLFNMSIWESIDALRAYVYRGGHAEYFSRRAEWFEKTAEAHLALWWIPAGGRPTVEDGMARIARLNEAGPTPEAFTFRSLFPPPARPY